MAYPSQIGDGDPNSPLLKPKDFDDARKMAMLLADYNKPISRFVMGRLSPQTRQLLAPQTMPYSLMHDLNLVLNIGPIYSPDRIAGPSIPGAVRALAASNPTGARLARANRLLLEAVYPDEILKRPADRVEGRLTSLVTVLIAMFVGGIVYFGLLRLLRVEEADFVWNIIRRTLLRHHAVLHHQKIAP